MTNDDPLTLGPLWANNPRPTTNDGSPRLTLLSLSLYTQDQRRVNRMGLTPDPVYAPMLSGKPKG